MRLFLWTATLGALAGAQGLATDYGRERTLRITASSDIDLETTAFEMKVDDQPVDSPGGGSSSSLVRKLVLLEHVLAGEAGQATKVRRTFETVGETSEASFGEDTRSDEREGPLQGVTLELVRDDEGAVQAEVVEGDAPEDAALLEGLEIGLALDAFLPEGESAKGASWELDDAAVRRGLASAFDAHLYPEPTMTEGGGGGGGGERGGGRRGGRGRGGPARVLAHIEWSGKATLAEAEVDHEGVKCARIHLVLEGEGELPEPSFGGGGGRGRLFEPAAERAPLAGTVHAKLEGELFIALEARRPAALELDGELSTDNTYEREREGQRMWTHSAQGGRWSVVVTVEEQGS